MRRCFPGLWALFLVSAAACGPSAPAAKVETPKEAELDSAPRPGFEEGFTHCCGDLEYVMQIDCSDRLLRCYANEEQGWHQTYGRNCKSALGSSCYERGCISVCDSF